MPISDCIWVSSFHAIWISQTLYHFRHSAGWLGIYGQIKRKLCSRVERCGSRQSANSATNHALDTLSSSPILASRRCSLSWQRRHFAANDKHRL